MSLLRRIIDGTQRRRTERMSPLSVGSALAVSREEERYANDFKATVQRVLGRRIVVQGSGYLERQIHVVDPGMDFIGKVTAKVIFIQAEDLVFTPELGTAGLLAVRVGVVPDSVCVMMTQMTSNPLFQTRYRCFHRVRSMADIGRLLRQWHDRCGDETQRKWNRSRLMVLAFSSGAVLMTLWAVLFS